MNKSFLGSKDSGVLRAQEEDYDYLIKQSNKAELYKKVLERVKFAPTEYAHKIIDEELKAINKANS
ncbi:hypothetical protein [Paraliobacillus ryukyuensis]|uniref:hypothetical protein n=1 Tax=Paraliobacillus ryukyuensis TaxID=200904 RepID=UPI0009A62E88|nr:hypothetical protein [Paraliobacillus ryukyuensis]